MKKYTMPTIPPEDMRPEMEELVAFVKEVTDHTNALYEEGVALRKEIALAKKAKTAKQRASGSRK